MNLRHLLAFAIKAYSFLIIIRVVLSWVVAYARHPAHFLLVQIHIFLIQLTEPVLDPVRNMLRRIFPTMRFDFSPFIVILALDWIRNFLIYGIR